MSTKKFAKSQLVPSQADYIAAGKTPADVAIENIKNTNDKPTKRKTQPQSQESILDFFEMNKREKKTARINVLITPSLQAKVKESAERLGLSVNEYVNIALTNIVEKQSKEQ